MYYMWSKFGTFPSDFYNQINDEPGQLKVLEAFFEYRLKFEEKLSKNNVPGFVSI